MPEDVLVALCLPSAWGNPLLIPIPFAPEESNLVSTHHASKVLVAQSYPMLCHPIDFSPPGSSVCGILQAKILMWTAIPFSRGSS